MSTPSRKSKHRVLAPAPPKATRAAAPPPQQTPGNAPPDVTQLIRERAFQIFLSRRGGPGDAVSDWLQAERELFARGAPTSRVPTGASEVRASARGETLLHSDY